MERVNLFLFQIIIITTFLIYECKPINALVITSPTNMTTVSEGETITVHAERSPTDPEFLSVEFIVGNPKGGGCDEEITQPPYECVLTIPPGTPPEIVIRAVGEPPDGDGILSQLVTINVRTRPTTVLHSLKALGNRTHLFLKTGDTEQIYVNGQFSDGVQRNLEASAAGTTYQTSDSKIATVDPEGLVTAVSSGKAIITIRNQDKQLLIQVDVRAK